MNATEYLKGLNEHDSVGDTAERYEYTEQQLINFAKRYHEKQLKLLRIGGIIECLEQVYNTLERHGKVESNTDLHHKLEILYNGLAMCSADLNK